MILRIIAILFAGLIILYIAYWVWTGGISRGIHLANFLDNPFNVLMGSTTGSILNLPGQPTVTGPSTIDTSGDGGTGVAVNTLTTSEELSNLQDQYQQLSTAAKDPRNFGNPSPYKNKISFGLGDPQESSASIEYVTLAASYANSAPISLAGWTLQSAVTGLRTPLPHAAPGFVTGIVNTLQYPSLEPGATAYVVSGTSPVGVSIKENICTGYLAELQTCTPELSKQCPLGTDEMPLNAQNVANFGDGCIDYARSLPQCHFPGLDPKPSVTDACSNFLLNRMTYNGCVAAHRNDINFYTGSWRLFLGSNAQLWRDTHDVIRLLDDQGRTVDVLTY